MCDDTCGCKKPEITIQAPVYKGSRDDLVKALEALQRQGRLPTVRR